MKHNMKIRPLYAIYNFFSDKPGSDLCSALETKSHDFILSDA